MRFNLFSLNMSLNDSSWWNKTNPWFFFSKTKAKVALIFIRRFNFVDDFILSSIFFFIHFTLLATYLKMNMLTYAQTHTVHFFQQSFLWLCIVITNFIWFHNKLSTTTHWKMVCCHLNNDFYYSLMMRYLLNLFDFIWHNSLEIRLYSLQGICLMITVLQLARLPNIKVDDWHFFC